MIAKATFKRVGFSLVPIGRDALKLFSAIKDGAQVFIEVWQPRNMSQHRKYFAVLNNVVDATGRWTSSEHLRRDILLALHHYDEAVNEFTGEVTKVPHSMKVASMPRAQFEQLYDDTIRLLTDELGADPEMLTQEAA